MKIDFVKTLEASSPYTPGRIYFEESTSLIKVATASNQYRVFGGVRSADYDSSTDILTILNGNGDEIYIDFSQYVNQDEYEDDQYVISVALTELNNSISSISDNVDYLGSQVSDMGYSMQELHDSIPTDSSIAAWGYTKNALAGVSFNGVDASVTNGVASIAPYHIDLNGDFLYITLNGSCVLQIVTTYRGQYENCSVTHLINVDVSSNNIFVKPICLGDATSCFFLWQFHHQNTWDSPVGISDERSRGRDLILTIKIYNDEEDPNATKSADITVLGGTPPLSYTISNTIIQEHSYSWDILHTNISSLYYDSTDRVLYAYDNGGVRTQIFTASNIVSDGGGLTSETDPIFNASAAAGITSTDITNWNSKGNAKIFYGTCSVGADIVTKVVSCNDFTSADLVKGALIFVTFTNTNTVDVDDLKMNVNNTGLKPLKQHSSNSQYAGSIYPYALHANCTYLFTYDGTNWVLLTTDRDTNTTYSTISQSEAQTGTSTTGRLVSAASLKRDIEYRMAQNQADWNVTDTTSLKYIANKPTITTDASVAAWGYLKANDVSTKVEKSNAVSSLSLGMNSSTYTITLSGTMADGSTFTVGNPVDLPLETMVVDGSYNSSTKKVSLGLKNGSSVEFSVADLVAGLQSEITSSNKLSADLIQDGTTNKVVTATDKNKWNNLVSNVQADWNATSGLSAILNKPTIPTVNNATLSILKNGTSVGTFTANSSTDTSINIQVNELPTPSTVGVFLTSYWDQETSTCVWRESTHIYDVSNTIYLGYGIPLRAYGSYGDTVLATGGILKTNFSDWSWINIQYQENNTTVTKNLQDYLDDFILSPDVPSTSGRIAESYYNSTTKRYAWKASDIYSITSPHAILAQPTGGFSVLKNTTDNPRTVYSLGSGGVGGANVTDWSWIKRWSNNVTTTLQDDLNAKQDTLIGSGTGQNIKTVNNNSLVGSGNVSVGTLTGVKFNNTSATINGAVAEITATIPPDNVFVIPVTKSGTTYSTTVTKSEARAAIDANKLLFVRMAHNRMVMPLRSYDTDDYGDYYFYAVSQYYIYTIHLVASGSDGPLSCYYTESALPSAITESTVSGWGFTKNTGTLTGVKFNNVSATINGTVAEITATIPAAVTESTVSGWGFTKNAAPGTLKTNNTTAQTASSGEALSGTINLHKVAKTGTYSDLIGTPNIPAAANNATITIQKGGTNVDSFTVNASTNKTINIPNELPTVSASDNGKILKVVSGAWAAATPVTVYSGSNAPNNSTGINGDIYIQS